MAPTAVIFFRMSPTSRTIDERRVAVGVEVVDARRGLDDGGAMFSASTRLSTRPTSMFVLWFAFGAAMLGAAPSFAEEASVIDEARNDCSTGCSALDTFGSHKQEAEGGPVLNWAAWGCWTGAFLGFACTPAAPPFLAAFGAIFGLFVGGMVDDFDPGWAWVWGLPGLGVGLLISVIGLAVIGGFLYVELTTTLDPGSQQLYVAGASLASTVLAAGALISGPMAMAGIVHGLHAGDGTEVAQAPRESSLKLATVDDAMLE